MKSSSQREIEIKLLVENFDETVRRIRKLGAQPAGRVFEQNALFDTTISGFRKSGRLLRVRFETSAPGSGLSGGRNRTILTYKAPVPAPPKMKQARNRTGLLKERLEREIVSEARRDWTASLRSLGFVCGFRYEKYRSTFLLPGLHLDLDQTPVGIFLEIEGRSAAIHHAAADLGYSRRDYISGTYWDLYVEDCLRRGTSPQHMLFNP